ncbi:MAG: ATP-binding protein [Clostridia bacterium]|nr:ATP-binding protein [Clostridia bacterium]
MEEQAMAMIVLTGMPATGKSTISAALAKAFGYPVVEKDAIKEQLFDTLGFTCYAEKRALDHAANAVVIHVVERILKTGGSVIVDNNFDTESGKKFAALLEEYAPASACVFFYGDAEVLRARYNARDNAHARHLGHLLQEHYPPHPEDSLYHEMTREEFHEKFMKRGMDSFVCPGERLEIDTTDFSKVDPAAIVAWVKNVLD